MGNFISITAVLGFVIIGGFYFLSTQLQMGETNRGVAGDEYAVLARSAAIAGSERAKQHLARSFTEESFEGYFDQGTYAVEVSISGLEATISSEGSLVTSEGIRVARTIRSVVDQAPETVPLGFGFGLLVGGDLSVAGTGDVLSVGVADSAAATLNASMHTNSNLQTEGSSAVVAGFGSYSGTVGGRHVETIFQPNYNPYLSPPVAFALPVDIPTVDPLHLADDFGMDVNIRTDMPDSWDASADWNCDLSGTLEGGSATNPRVYYCPGSLRMENLVFDGYAVIIADGRTEIDRFVGTNVSTYPDGETTSLAIYSGGDILMDGHDEVEAHLFTNGTLQNEGRTRIHGSLTTGDGLYLSGTAKIQYLPNPVALVPPDERDTRLRLLAYSEEW
ncbi:MAG: hypothetical protein IIC18_08070 [Bacteroidetes bacterium]|nr:hypothetical protein [Bacteroidota bacterium]